MTVNNLKNSTNTNRVPSKTAPASLSIDQDDTDNQNSDSVLFKVKIFNL